MAGSEANGGHTVRPPVLKQRSPEPKKPKIEEYNFGPWNIKTVKSHILTSAEEESLSSQLELPHLPDMLFLHNSLACSHSSGLTLEFNPLDALKRVNAHEDLIHVSNAKDWLAARQNSPHINKIIHPFDWTYSTDYSGTLTSSQDKSCSVELTEEKINYEKLKIQEKILFFDEVVLYEDELDDNGCAKLATKIRVMPSGFFILLRFYLRVDNTLIRVYDTRIYFEVEKNYLLREYSEREESTDKLGHLERSLWTDHNLIVEHLPVKHTHTHRIPLE